MKILSLSNGKVQVLLLILALSSAPVFAADVYALVKDLGSNSESTRASAVAELVKMGDGARVTLVAIEAAHEIPKNVPYFKDLLSKAEAAHEEKDVAGLREMLAKIDAARATLSKAGVTAGQEKDGAAEGLEPRQLLLIRRILGALLIGQSSLQPIDAGTLIPFGSDKEKGIKGTPDLLFNIDKKVIMMEGEFAIEQGPLEYLVVSKGPNARLHETVAAVRPIPHDICYALLACNYTFAGELGEEGQVNLPKGAGAMISIEFLWEDPHASMDTGVDVSAMAAGLKQKDALYEKAGEAEKAQLLFDMESDIAILRGLYGQDIPTLDFSAPLTVTQSRRRTVALLELSGIVNGLHQKDMRFQNQGQPLAEPERGVVLAGILADVNKLKVLLGNAVPALEPFVRGGSGAAKALEDNEGRKTMLAALDEYLKNPPDNVGDLKPLAAAPLPSPLPQKKLVRVPIEFFSWNSQTDRTMKRAPFAFTGSRIEKDQNNKPVFMADEEKSIVALKLDPYAILNTPLNTRGIDPQHAAGYGINQYIIPKRHTRCRVIIEPWTGTELKPEDLVDTGIDRGPAPPPTPTP